MKKSLCLVLAFFIIVSINFRISFASTYKTSQTEKSYAVFDIKNISGDELDKFKNDEKVISWCQIDDKLIITCDETNWPAPPAGFKKMRAFKTAQGLSEPFLAIRRGQDSPLSEYAKNVVILFEKGPYSVFQAPMSVINELSKLENNHFKLEKFDRNLPLRIDSKYVKLPGRAKSSPAAAIEVNKKRISDNITALQNFKTRYSYTDGYTKSAEWAAEEFKKMGLEVKMHEYMDGKNKQINVVAQKSFSSSEKFYIVCGHLDSVSPKAQTDAPGADDNASGSAGVLEAAHILSKTASADRFRFVLFAAEELGLKGSGAYVKELKNSGEIAKIEGVVNFDMIGFDKTPPLSALFETYKNNEAFIANFIEEANNQPNESQRLKISISYNPWGSDHIPFLRAAVPCFLFIEEEFEANTTYHKTTDKIECVNIDLSAEFVRVTVATLLRLVSGK